MVILAAYGGAGATDWTELVLWGESLRDFRGGRELQGPRTLWTFEGKGFRTEKDQDVGHWDSNGRDRTKSPKL